jgi:hypothetical protein
LAIIQNSIRADSARLSEAVNAVARGPRQEMSWHHGRDLIPGCQCSHGGKAYRKLSEFVNPI